MNNFLYFCSETGEREKISQSPISGGPVRQNQIVFDNGHIIQELVCTDILNNKDDTTISFTVESKPVFKANRFFQIRTLENDGVDPDLSLTLSDKFNGCLMVSVLTDGKIHHEGLVWKVPNLLKISVDITENSISIFVNGTKSITLRDMQFIKQDCRISIGNDIIDLYQTAKPKTVFSNFKINKPL